MSLWHGDGEEKNKITERNFLSCTVHLDIISLFISPMDALYICLEVY